MIVFIPATLGEAQALRAGAALHDVLGCAPTAELAARLGSNPLPEETDYAALVHAGVLSLLHAPPPRLVLAVDLRSEQPRGYADEDGQVVVDVSWSGVQALFADAAETSDLVHRARSAIERAGLQPGQDSARTPGWSGQRDQLRRALELSEVDRVVESCDLLWFAPEELDRL